MDAPYDITDGGIVDFYAAVGMQDAIVGRHPRKTAHNAPRHNPPFLLVGELCREHILYFGV
jgi:hypothetical protein